MIDHNTWIHSQQYLSMPNIETSTRCTLRCPQCARAKLYESKDTQSYKDVKSRISAGYDLSINEAEKLLDFFKQGIMLCGSISDPVVWPYFIDFLKLRKEKYPTRKLRIYTAASQKNIEWYKEAFSLCNENDVWIFGIDGFEDTSPLYRIGQNSKLMFDAMLLAKSMNIGTDWQFIVFEHNVHQIDRAKEFAKTHNINLLLMKSDRTGGGVSVPANWKPERNKEIINAV